MFLISSRSVSYTHLDVYKRQLFKHHHQSTKLNRTIEKYIKKESYIRNTTYPDDPLGGTRKKETPVHTMNNVSHNALFKYPTLHPVSTHT